MIDLLVPVPARSSSVAIACIEKIVENTNFPFRMIVVVDGGRRQDFAALESHLNSSEFDWTILHNEQPIYLNRSIKRAIDIAQHPLFALVMPHVRVVDSMWFSKAKVIFDKDPACAMVDTAPRTSSETLPPSKRPNLAYPGPGCGLAIVKLAFAKLWSPIGHIDPIEYWTRAAMGNGYSAWHASGIHYVEVENQRQELWREPSAPQTQSASRSPTTPT